VRRKISGITGGYVSTIGVMSYVRDGIMKKGEKSTVKNRGCLAWSRRTASKEVESPPSNLSFERNFATQGKGRLEILFSKPGLPPSVTEKMSNLKKPSGTENSSGKNTRGKGGTGSSTTELSCQGEPTGDLLHPLYRDIPVN